MVFLQNVDTKKAALLMMHFQDDVFRVLAGSLPTDMLDRANNLIDTWRKTERPVIFANLLIKPNEPVTENNKLITTVKSAGLFRESKFVEGLDVQPSDRIYTCLRASVFHGTNLDHDLRAQGIDTLVMAGIASSGVLFSTVAWASDADYRIYLARACCFDPDVQADEALFRTSFATRATLI
ncbi:isochorismatase family cysteine hydrolase [Bdellovibrio sp. HCB185ZH]|uniref:isochorismatase family cysteine hydrolase n=1 Tax=Bdellovibrio sp. HCB185ZH TaxID=3394235 RepID=UPI0039A51E38